MAWMQDFPGATVIEAQTERAWRLPLGAVSPLWAMFGVAATSGVAYWWLSQWRRTVNVEAMAGAFSIPVRPQPPRQLERAAIAPPEVATAMSEVEAAPAEVVVEAAPAVDAEATAASVEAPAPAVADDLTRMTGIGPKLAGALAARGVTRFAQIAAWTDADVAEADAALSLKGRAAREAWVAQ